MAKINKIFIKYNHFWAIQTGVYITTFESNRKRSLKSDLNGYFFTLNGMVERITNEAEIQRINEFINN
jgi:hypothetical protein